MTSLGLPRQLAGPVVEDRVECQLSAGLTALEYDQGHLLRCFETSGNDQDVSLRRVLAIIVAPLLVPAYAVVASGGGTAADVLVLALFSQALAFVVGGVVVLLKWKPSAIQAILLGAATGAAIPATFALLWRATEVPSTVAVLIGLGAAVGFLYWLIAWWHPAATEGR